MHCTEVGSQAKGTDVHLVTSLEGASNMQGKRAAFTESLSPGTMAAHAVTGAKAST